jgi:hypothetical protein
VSELLFKLVLDSCMPSSLWRWVCVLGLRAGQVESSRFEVAVEQLLICGALARDRWRVETKKAEKKGSQSARSKQLGYAASLGKVSQPTRTEKLAYAASLGSQSVRSSREQKQAISAEAAAIDITERREAAENKRHTPAAGHHGWHQREPDYHRVAHGDVVRSGERLHEPTWGPDESDDSPPWNPAAGGAASKEEPGERSPAGHRDWHHSLDSPPPPDPHDLRDRLSFKDSQGHHHYLCHHRGATIPATVHSLHHRRREERYARPEDLSRRREAAQDELSRRDEKAASPFETTGSVHARLHHSVIGLVRTEDNDTWHRPSSSESDPWNRLAGQHAHTFAHSSRRLSPEQRNHAWADKSTARRARILQRERHAQLQRRGDLEQEQVQREEQQHGHQHQQYEEEQAHEDEEYICAFQCGYCGNYEEVLDHEAVCSSQPKTDSPTVSTGDSGDGMEQHAPKPQEDEDAEQPSPLPHQQKEEEELPSPPPQQEQQDENENEEQQEERTKDEEGEQPPQVQRLSRTSGALAEDTPASPSPVRAHEQQPWNPYM